MTFIASRIWRTKISKWCQRPSCSSRPPHYADMTKPKLWSENWGAKRDHKWACYIYNWRAPWSLSNASLHSLYSFKDIENENLKVRPLDLIMHAKCLTERCRKYFCFWSWFLRVWLTVMVIFFIELSCTILRLHTRVTYRHINNICSLSLSFIHIPHAQEHFKFSFPLFTP